MPSSRWQLTGHIATDTAAPVRVNLLAGPVQSVHPDPRGGTYKTTSSGLLTAG